MDEQKMTERSDSHPKLSDDFKSIRNKTVLICSIAAAWSTAQFEIKKFTIDGIGEIDFSGVSIPLLLGITITYLSWRCGLEYMMQPKHVRRWRFARYDFRALSYLFRMTLLLLAFTGLSRSVETMAYVIIAIVSFFIMSLFLEGPMMGITVPLTILVRRKQGRNSIASQVIEANGWARVIILTLTIAGISWLGYASLYLTRFSKIWTSPPSPMSVWVCVAGCSLFIVSVVFEENRLSEIFSLIEENGNETTIYNEDGTIDFAYKRVRE